MKYIVEYGMEIILGLLTSGFVYLFQKLKISYNKILHTQKGVEALLKNHIVEKYHECQEKGEMTLYDKEAINEMYIAYKKLGGNGVVEKLVKDIAEAPTITCEERSV